MRDRLEEVGIVVSISGELPLKVRVGQKIIKVHPRYFRPTEVDSLLGALFENRGYLTKGGVNTLAITSGMMFMWAWLRFI